MTTLRLISLATLIGLTGCFSLAREQPRQQHYVLGGSVSQEAPAPSGELDGIRVGVRRLQLASYLVSPFIVVRRGTHEITFSEFHRWGERLDGGINHALAGHLTARAPFRGVDVAPWTPREEFDYLIQVQVLRFEGLDPGSAPASKGEVHVLATWEIIRQTDGAVLSRGTTDHRETGWNVGDYSGLVTSLDRGLNVLSADLVSSMESLGATLAERR